MSDNELRMKTLKVALAAFLHDIGKFAQRSRGEFNSNDPAFYPSMEFLNNHRQNIQPYDKEKNKFTHEHAVYTAAFIDHMEALLPDCFNKSDWGGSAWIGELAAGHHILKEDEGGSQPLERWVISVADRLASSLDREGAQEFERSYNLKEEIANFKCARQWPIMEAIKIKQNEKNTEKTAFKHRIPLAELSGDKFFPKPMNETIPSDNEKGKEEYKTLFYRFYEELKGLKQFKSNVELWFAQFENLYMRYAGQIPAATVGNAMQDISLYDHSKITAAIATALYLYHEKTGKTSFQDVNARDQKKLLFVGTSFFGIQKFIFASGGSTNKAGAKILRGRSFYVSLFSEIIADMLLKATDLPITSVVFNAAGQIAIIAPNLDYIKEAVMKIKDRANNWLIEKFYGQTSLGVAYSEVSQADIGFKYREVWSDFSRKMEEQKYEKFDLAAYGGVQKQFFDAFKPELGVCSFCGQKPAKNFFEDSDKPVCGVCEDQIYLGKKLVTASALCIWNNESTNLPKLAEPIFGSYNVWLGGLGEGINQAVNGNIGYLVRLTDAKDEQDKRKVAFKPLKAYVPFFEESYEIKSFEDLAQASVKEDIKTGEKIGVAALGILKADVDNLGKIFKLGLNSKIQTLTRTSVLSRQFNNFFALYLPQKLEAEFKNTYTVFAGGDDLFLIGPYDEIIELAPVIREEFRRFVCGNDDITLSMGISIHKPGEPVRAMAEAAENALERAKSYIKEGKDKNTAEIKPDKDAICLFGETVGWKDFKFLDELAKKIRLWVEKGDVSTGILYKFNSAVEDLVTVKMLEKKRQEGKRVRFSELANALSWKARLKYSLIRSESGKKDSTQGDEELRRAELGNMVKWLEEYGTSIRIPLWKEIYRRRKN